MIAPDGTLAIRFISLLRAHTYIKPQRPAINQRELGEPWPRSSDRDPCIVTVKVTIPARGYDYDGPRT